MKKNKSALFFISLFFLFLFFIPFLFASEYGDKIERNNYIISRDKVVRTIAQGELFQDSIGVTNLAPSSLYASFSVSGVVVDCIDFEISGLQVPADNTTYATFLIKGTVLGNYSGEIVITGDIEETIPVNIEVVESPLDPSFILEVSPLRKSFRLNGFIEFELDLNKLKIGHVDSLNLSYSIKNSQTNETIFLGSESFNLTSSQHLIKKFKVPEQAIKGDYILKVFAKTQTTEFESNALFILKKPFLHVLVFGFLPMWALILFLGVLTIGLLTFYLIKRRIKKMKKYKMDLNVKKLPKEDKKFLRLGKIAEMKIGAYLDPEKLKTHCIVAGATGGGKSISAQVIIEEALLQNIAVIVFDPTAQWSGMLRKCDDKKMISYYPKFGLKASDAKAFPGNIRQVTDAREIIEIEKFINPGQIQIFTMNKLDPKDIDIFVANVIRQIFKSDPKETPNIKMIMVFDEVHRLLSKFGGSGEGFLQIERACREFRKWGMGVMLVSQVLNDFMGEIKANISTEIQMRTRDEGDLGRIKTKYGETFLQSLVKASVGVGMFVNPAYNAGKPYFINFRPILHNTRRLSDEELEKYNQYNNLIDDIEYQIEQLEELKVDVFDLKMELKLIKDKVMTGNFSVVDIYAEGLKPRLEKSWQKLGKKPKKKQKKLADLSEIMKSVEEAKAARKKFEENVKKQEATQEQQKKTEESLDDKILKALTFDNGIMVSSLGELKDVLPNLDVEIFKLHVNDQKNDIAKWLEGLSPDLAVKAKTKKTKQELIDLLKITDKKPEQEEKENQMKEKEESEEVNEEEE